MNFTVFLCVYILSESVLVRGDKYQMHIMQNSSYNCRLQIVIELEFKIKLRFRENNKTALTCLLQFEQDSNSYCIHLEQSHATITMASDSTTRGKVGKQSFISLARLNFFRSLDHCGGGDSCGLNLYLNLNYLSQVSCVLSMGELPVT